MPLLLFLGFLFLLAAPVALLLAILGLRRINALQAEIMRLAEPSGAQPVAATEPVVGPAPSPVPPMEMPARESVNSTGPMTAPASLRVSAAPRRVNGRYRSG